MNALAPIALDLAGPVYPALPNDVVIEQSILGILLVRPAVIPELEAVCPSESFFDPLHRRIVTAVYEMSRQNIPVTPLTLKARLEPDPGLSLVGGITYLASLALGAPQDSIASLGRIVADLAVRREAMIAIWDAQERLSRTETPVSEIMAPVVAVADRAAESGNAGRSTQASVTAHALVDVLEHGARSDLVGEPITTGIPSLNELIGGLYPGNLVIVGGRSGMGKSSLGTVMARAAAEYGAYVDYFSLEMSKAELTARIVTDMDFDRMERGDVPLAYSRLLKRKASPGEIVRARQMAERLREMDLEIHDRPMGMAEISALSRAKASRKGRQPGVVIVDHLHRIRVTDRYRGSRVGELTEITAAGKALAKTINRPVVFLAQLNREAEKRDGNKRPQLSDLRESGSIEEDADVVILLYRPAYYVKYPPLGPSDAVAWAQYLADIGPIKHDIDIDVAKNRHGETKLLRCYTEIGAAAIRDCAP